jgi:N-acetylneuraminic acid mutarotase
MKFLLFTINFLVFTFFASANWNQRAILPANGRVIPNSFVINNKAYVGGGFDSFITYYNDLWEYDPGSNTWMQKANSPVAVGGACSFSIQNKGYLVCGWINGLNTNGVYEYDPNLNSWITKNNFPGGARYSASFFVINNTAYIGLGFSPLRKDFWAYDALNDSWIQKTDFPGSSRQGTVHFAINGIGYVGLGLSNSSTLAGLSDFYSYNPGNNSWTQLTNFYGPARHTAFSFVRNGKAYVGAGLDGNIPNVPFNDFYQFDPNTSSWTPIDSLPGDPRENGTAFTIGSCGYIFGGVNFSSSTSGYFYNDLWEYCGTVGIEDENSYSDISVFYNQNSNTFNLDFNSHPFKKGLLIVYDVQGKCALSADIDQSQTSFLFNEATGIYYYRLLLDNKIIKSGKIMN